MVQIIKFPRPVSYSRIRARDGVRHLITVRIIDPENYEEARWHLQWAMMHAASFKCLKGFNNEAARRRKIHRFKIGHTELMTRFLLETEILVFSGRVVIAVDGVEVGIRRRRA